MKVSEYLAITFKEGEEHQSRNAVICNDGFTVSIQTSAFHYCAPRETVRDHLSVELGFPSQEDELINEFAEDNSKYTDTVYGYVPIKVVEELIFKHKGIDIKKTFKL